MNIILMLMQWPFQILAQSQSPPMLIILFWLLIFLWALGAFFGPKDQPWVIQGTNGVLLVLFLILGFHTFGNPFH